MAEFFSSSQKYAAEGLQKLNQTVDEAKTSLVALEEIKESHPENEDVEVYIKYLRNYLRMVTDVNDLFQRVSKDGAALLRESR